MNPKEISTMSVLEMRTRMEKRELSPVDVVKSCLHQIEQHNPEINAICTIAENALQQAEQAEQRFSQPDPPVLCGIPVGIKDITPTEGIRTTYGSVLYKDEIPTEDAEVVKRLKKAGAIILAKTNTPEFAAGGNTFNEIFGCTRNPWNPKLSAGGSTGGGAAALATGMIALAEGTDLGGSLRIPASFCGIVGLRPSPGLVPTYPSSYAYDNLQVTGPMARTAEDIALMLQAISGPSEYSPICQPIDGRDFLKTTQKGVVSGTRFAYCSDISGIGVEPEVEEICRKAAFSLEQQGAVVEEIEFDLSFARPAFLALRGLWMVAHHLHHADKMEHLGDNVAGNIRAGLTRTGEELGEAERVRGQVWHKFREFFGKYDQLLTPCMAISPFSVEQNYPETIAGKKMKTYVDWIAPTFVLSMTGLPVSSVPCGTTQQKLPVGLQIVAKPQGEEFALATAHSLQKMHSIGLPI